MCKEGIQTASIAITQSAATKTLWRNIQPTDNSHSNELTHRSPSSLTWKPIQYHTCLQEHGDTGVGHLPSLEDLPTSCTLDSNDQVCEPRGEIVLFSSVYN